MQERLSFDRLRAELQRSGYRVEPRGGPDFIDPGGRVAIDVKTQRGGIRDLRDGALQIARSLQANPNLSTGVLVTRLERVNPQRVRQEWHEIMQMLRPEIAGRMRLLAVVNDQLLAEPPGERHSEVGQQIALWAQQEQSERASGESSSAPPTKSPLGAAWRQLEVEKVLLHRWLLQEGPIAVGALARKVGCSHPTALNALRRLAQRGLIQRKHGHAAALARYGRADWEELFRVQRAVYPPVEFVDPTGRAGVAEGLIRRLERSHVRNAALGGVVAARRWDEQFDLNGTPRIDVVLHTPVASAPYGPEFKRDPVEFARTIDPGLRRRIEGMAGSPALVVHQTYRQDPLFVSDPSAALLAEPVETLTHLNDLGLTAQAGALLKRLREREIRP